MKKSWGSLYRMDGNDIKTIEQNNDYYQNLLPECCSTIEDCVENALDSANHSAFAKYYFTHTYSADNLFRLILSEKREKTGYTIQQVMQWKIMKDSCFLDRNRMPDKEDYLSGSAIKNYFFKSKPKKYALVQLGIYLGLDHKEIDKLLIMSGNERLYPLNWPDAVCIFMIDHYKSEYKQKTPVEMIGIIKDTINSKEAPIYADNLRIQSKSEASIIYRDYSIKRGETMIDSLGEKITLFYRNSIENCSSLEELLAYRYTDIPLALNRLNECFLNARAGRKNLKRIQIGLDPYMEEDDIWGLACGDVEGSTYLNQAIEEYMENSVQGDELSITAYRDIIRMLSGINQNVLWGDEELYDYGNPGMTWMIVDKLLNGVQEKRGISKSYSFIRNEKQRLKKQLIKLCILLGCEDYIGEYLMAGNVWAENLLKKQHSEEERMNDTDAILIYAIHYRDRLITRLAEQLPLKSHTEKIELKRNLKKNFPVMELMFEIESDIFTAYLSLLNTDATSSAEKQKVKKKTESMIFWDFEDETTKNKRRK